MIWLTRVDGSPILLNDDQIVTAEASHDTVLCLVGGDRLRVVESPDEVAERVAAWRRRILGLDLLGVPEPGAATAPAATDGED